MADGPLFDPRSTETSVFQALLDARRKYGGGRVTIHDADDRELTYEEIVRASFALGGALKKGTKAREAVGVMLPTGAAAVISFFALNAHGRVPAMLNFTAGLRNLKAALTAASVKRIVTARQFIEKAELGELVEGLSAVAEIVYLEDVKAKLGLPQKLGALLGSRVPNLVAAAAKPDDPAVILFTSGTEGDPKGVVLSHRNVVANVRQVLAHVPEALTPSDIIYNPLPTFHCFGLTAGALLPILGGMKAALHPSPLHTKQIAERIRQTRATILFATDTFLNQYIRASSSDELSGLRFAVCGAERVRDETRDLVRRRFNVELLEGYGATEASPVIAVNQPGQNRPGTVGRPLPRMELRFEPVTGIAAGGRMFVKGPNVMLGYLSPDRPGELQPPPEGWHDTGDVVDQDEDGYLTIRGRLKRFAKIGGEMVSLTVVENCASAVWRDHDHAATVVPSLRKGEDIVLLTTNPQADRAELLRWAQSHGVSEMTVPKKILHVDQVPTLSTGKTDFGAVQKIANSLCAPAPATGMAADPLRAAS
jgi:acyl-[acyl-carrier-protein]-phospholipid O-acyltransferase/long-chain-fatty-acid--[acyl-carrier-protein] ligase